MGEQEVRLSTDNVPLYSVRDIVRRRVLPPDESGEDWHLAIVQRNLLWNEERMVRLLDSLLRGYPIGSLLFCELQQKSYGIDLRDKANRAGQVEKLSATKPQLVDGQQRIHALACIFSEASGESAFSDDFGEFFVNLAVKLETKLVDSRKKAKHLDKYIKGIEDGDRKKLGKPRPDGTYEDAVFGWFKLGGFLNWDQKLPKGTDHRELIRSADEELFLLIKEMDAGFEASELNELDKEGIKDLVIANFRRLLKAWFEPRIPARTIRLDRPTDVLEVFLRSNLEGVRLAGEDAFFAAVKTLWPDTEEHLARIENAMGGLIRRPTALRVLARIAHYNLYKRDLLPLSVERLDGVEGGKLKNEMEKISENKSKYTEDFIAKLKILSDRIINESNIGYGLRFVNVHCWDHVMAWAGFHDHIASVNLEAVYAYLVGATGLRLHTIFGDAYSRLAFQIAIDQKHKRECFPVSSILESTREKWWSEEKKKPALGHREILTLTDQAETLAFVNTNGKMMLCIAQEIPFDVPHKIEWDHIYPQSKADRFRIKKDGSHKLSAHRDRWHVWHWGNMMALHEDLNRAALADWPLDKLDKIKKNQYSKSGKAIEKWPSNLFIDEADEFKLGDVQKIINSRAFKIENHRAERAMEEFKKYVAGRSNRMFNKVNTLFEIRRNFTPLWDQSELKETAHAPTP
ncbi:DUF262 domain-containing protein [bacterium]|nr:DUF262 domain-containing protein [bacterium]